MKCYNHNDVDAVAACLSCGKGLCVPCADAYEKPFCEKCATAINEEVKAENTQILHTNLSTSRKTAIKKIFGIVWNAFFLISGIIAFIVGSRISSGEAIAGLVMNWGFSGLPWVMTSGILSDKGHVVIATPGILLIYGLTKLVIGFVIGAIASPILLIISIIILKKSLAEMRESKKQLAGSNLN